MNPWSKRSEMDMWNLRLGRITQDPAASSTPEGPSGASSKPGGRREKSKHFLDSSTESDASLSSASTASSSVSSSSSEEETEEQHNAKVAFLEQLGLRKVAVVATDASDGVDRKPPLNRKVQVPVKQEKQEPRKPKKRVRTGDGRRLDA